MAERPIWRGHLRLALVSCPIALHTAQRDAANLHFHWLNPETGNRVRMVMQDAETGAELSRRDLVRGFEFEKDRYVVLEDADFDAARIDSSSTITIDKFVDAASIDPIWFDGSYWLAPDGEAGLDVFAVLREAIRASGMMGLARVVMARRERPIALQAHGRGMVAHVLREARDITNPDALFRDIPAGKPDAEMVKLARQLIDRQHEDFAAADREDRYETRLRGVIDAKLKGEGVTPAPEEAEESNVIDLMAALRGSLGQQKVGASPRAPSKAKPLKSHPKARKSQAPGLQGKQRGRAGRLESVRRR